MIPTNTTISYAQNNEDIILNAFFKGVQKGFYVDVGANHPVQHSVTKNFYDRGWTGINIEPNPRMFKLLKNARPKDKNFNVGIANQDGKLKLRLYHSRDGLEGLSTFSDTVKTLNAKNPDEDNQDFDDIEVPVKKLSTILNEVKPKTIHFMKVDVEGFEYDVLSSNDWLHYRPHVLCIEYNHLMTDWHDLLKRADYSLAFTDGLNEYFIDDKIKASYDHKKLIEHIVADSTSTLKQHQYELWKKDLEANRQLSKAVDQQNKALEGLQKNLDRIQPLSLKDRSLIGRLKRSIYGLTIDWVRFKIQNTKTKKSNKN